MITENITENDIVKCVLGEKTYAFFGTTLIVEGVRVDKSIDCRILKSPEESSVSFLYPDWLKRGYAMLYILNCHCKYSHNYGKCNCSFKVGNYDKNLERYSGYKKAFKIVEDLPMSK